MSGRRRPLSLRAQLVLGSVAVVAVTFTALGLLLAAFFGHYFAAGRLTSLLVRARSVAAQLRAAPATANPRIAALVEDNGGHLWVVSEDGRVVRSFGTEGFGDWSQWVTPLELADVVAGHPWTRLAGSGGRDGQRLAVVAAPAAHVAGLPANRGAAVIWVAPVGGGSVLRAVAARVALVAVLGLLVAALLFTWLAGRLARPIRRLEEDARRIAGGDFALAPAELGPAPAEVRSLALSLREMAARLAEVDRSRRAFLADVSHELRSPLAALRGALEGIRGGTASRADRERYLAVAVGETARLGRLVDDLLTLSRSQAGRLELHRRPVDLREAVLRVALSLEPVAAARGVVLRFSELAQAPPVDADPDRLSQVLWNLLDNAVRHAPAGSEATVALRPTADGVCLEVGNPGPVIPPEDLARLFERFERGHSGGDGGTGLGLAIARTLAEAHGATITAASPPGGGLRITLCWPAAAPAA